MTFSDCKPRELGEAAGLATLELFVSVAETGSLGATAARYGMTQPSVSARMNSLEKRLGLRVLSRGVTGTRLTPAGEQLLAAAQRVLASSRAFATLAERLAGDSRQHLRVAASFTVAERLVPAWAGLMRDADSDVLLALDVVNTSRVLDLVRGGSADLGFVEGPETAFDGLATAEVGADSLVVVAGSGHPWAAPRSPVTGQELADAELIVREQGSGTREVLDRALEPWGGVHSMFEFGSTEAVLAAARRGQAPAVLSALAALPDVTADRLRVVPTEGLDLGRSLRAVWSRDTGLTKTARSMLTIARAHAYTPDSTGMP